MRRDSKKLISAYRASFRNLMRVLTKLSKLVCFMVKIQKKIWIVLLPPPKNNYLNFKCQLILVPITTIQSEVKKCP